MDATQLLDDDLNLHYDNDSGPVSSDPVASLELWELHDLEWRSGDSFPLFVGRNLIGRKPKDSNANAQDEETASDEDVPVHHVYLTDSSVSLEHAEIILQSMSRADAEAEAGSTGVLPPRAFQSNPDAPILDLHQVQVIDQKSTNKTHLSDTVEFVGVRCQARIPRPLKHGMFLSFGSVKARFLIHGMEVPGVKQQPPKRVTPTLGDATQAYGLQEEATLPYGIEKDTDLYAGSADSNDSTAIAPTTAVVEAVSKPSEATAAKARAARASDPTQLYDDGDDEAVGSPDPQNQLATLAYVQDDSMLATTPTSSQKSREPAPSPTKRTVSDSSGGAKHMPVELSPPAKSPVPSPLEATLAYVQDDGTATAEAGGSDAMEVDHADDEEEKKETKADSTVSAAAVASSPAVVVSTPPLQPLPASPDFSPTPVGKDDDDANDDDERQEVGPGDSHNTPAPLSLQQSSESYQLAYIQPSVAPESSQKKQPPPSAPGSQASSQQAATSQPAAALDQSTLSYAPSTLRIGATLASPEAASAPSQANSAKKASPATRRSTRGAQKEEETSPTPAATAAAASSAVNSNPVSTSSGSGSSLPLPPIGPESDEPMELTLNLDSVSQNISQNAPPEREASSSKKETNDSNSATTTQREEFKPEPEAAADVPIPNVSAAPVRGPSNMSAASASSNSMPGWNSRRKGKEAAVIEVISTDPQRPSSPNAADSDATANVAAAAAATTSSSKPLTAMELKAQKFQQKKLEKERKDLERKKALDQLTAANATEEDTTNNDNNVAASDESPPIAAAGSARRSSRGRAAVAEAEESSPIVKEASAEDKEPISRVKSSAASRRRAATRSTQDESLHTVVESSSSAAAAEADPAPVAATRSGRRSRSSAAVTAETSASVDQPQPMDVDEDKPVEPASTTAAAAPQINPAEAAAAEVPAAAAVPAEPVAEEPKKRRGRHASQEATSQLAADVSVAATTESQSTRGTRRRAAVTTPEKAAAPTEDIPQAVESKEQDSNHSIASSSKPSAEAELVTSGRATRKRGAAATTSEENPKEAKQSKSDSNTAEATAANTAEATAASTVETTPAPARSSRTMSQAAASQLVEFKSDASESSATVPASSRRKRKLSVDETQKNEESAAEKEVTAATLKKQRGKAAAKIDQMEDVPEEAESKPAAAAAAASSELTENGQENEPAAKRSRAKKPVADLATPAPAAAAAAESGRSYHLVLTGINPDALLGDSYVSQIESLHGAIVDDVLKCTHLITDKVRRTEKFLAAYSVVPHIVHWHWLRDSIKKGSFQPESSYLLQDSENESKFHFQLAKRDANVKFLQGWKVFLTPHVKPPPASMGAIIAAAGGSILTKAPTAFDATQLVVASAEEEEDKKLSAKLNGLGYAIHSNELVLTGVLRQKLEISDANHILLAAPSTSSNKASATRGKRK